MSPTVHTTNDRTAMPTPILLQHRRNGLQSPAPPLRLPPALLRRPIFQLVSPAAAFSSILFETPLPSSAPSNRHVLNCLVQNEPGVLSRVSGILAARGFNNGIWSMDNPRSVMLAVVPAIVDVATQEILELAVEADVHVDRTLGVLTKPDLVDRGGESGVVALLDGRIQRMKLGWGKEPANLDFYHNLESVILKDKPLTPQEWE
ncbi:acetolactate synthase, regulatory subunit [Elasticomyces elasticus]|nr:acetolactate synthase, regulatory subunit [Elasticomyces elasticus]